MGFIEEFKNRRLKRLADRAADKHGKSAKAVSDYMVRRAKRLAERFDEEPSSWITVNGNHIPLDEEQKPIGGQMKSFGDIGGKDYDPMFKPKNPSDEYDWEGVESVQDFIKKKANVEKTKAIFKEGGLDAVEQEFLFARMAESSKNLHEIKPKEDLSKYDDELDRIKLTQDAVSDELYEDVRESLIHGWTRGADSGYKPTILRAVIRTEKARNAALNLSYLAYQEYSALDKARGGEDHQEFKSFEDFLTTPIKMYRGENGQSRLKEDVFSAYSFDKRVAQHFAGNNGKVHEITVRPIDTLGNIVPTGEYEVMVPDWLEKRVRHDGKERLWLRLDENPDSWITLENGEHVPLDASGNALGGAGGWATGKNFSNANKGVEEKPKNSDYDWEGVYDFQSFMHKNAKKLKPIYENGGRDSVETEYRTAMMERSSHNLSEIKPVETGLKSIDRKEAINAAMDALVEEVGDSKLAGWLRNEDSSYKPAIMDGILSSDKARNAALNIMYRLYQYERDDTVSFEDFLTKPIKLYRGEHGQERVADDVFSAYSFDKRMAGKFAGENGKVHEIEVRPIDTLGSPRAAGEAEVMVPSWIEKKVRHDAADDGEWVTTENGNHVHISEEGFPDKGNPFVISEMNSEFLDAAKDADNAVEFWMNLSEDQQKKVGKNYKEIYESVKKVAGEKDEWVAPRGKIEDMPTKLEEPKEPIQFEIANQKHGGSATADADIKGKIRLYANQSDTWSDNVFYHELGHQIEQLGIETDVALNHGGLFGKYNQKKNVFASPTGYVEKNPDEMFATLFADYISRPSWLKEKAPEVHEYFDKLNADNPWLSGFVDQTKADYQTAIDRYQKRKDSVDEFRKRRQSRRDAKEDEGRWITTENGHRVHLNEEGEPDKGNPNVLKVMNDAPKKSATKESINKGFEEIIKASKERPKTSIYETSEEDVARYEEFHGKAMELLKDMPVGSKIKWNWTDDGKSQILTWNGTSWKGGRGQSALSVTMSEMADYLWDESDDRPTIHSVARSEESKEIARERKRELINSNNTYKHDGTVVGNHASDYSNPYVDAERRNKIKEEFDRSAMYTWGGDAKSYEKPGTILRDEIESRAKLRKKNFEGDENGKPQVEDVYDVLRDIRPFGLPANASDYPVVHSEIDEDRTAAIIREATDRFPTEWFEGCNGKRPTIFIHDSPGRGICMNGSIIHVYARNSEKLVSDLKLSDDKVSDMGITNTLAHELGHFIENHNPTVGTEMRSFLRERTQNGEEEFLEEGYTTKPDSFFNRYMGKQYPSGDTEILSVLVQSLGFVDPFDTINGKSYFSERKDPRSLKRILGMLGGL